MCLLKNDGAYHGNSVPQIQTIEYGEGEDYDSAN